MSDQRMMRNDVRPLPNGSKLTYYRTDKAWYGKNILDKQIDAEIMLSLKDEDEDSGTYGEFAIQFGRFSDTSRWAKLAMFTDAAHILFHYPQVVQGLAALAQTDQEHRHRTPTPEQVEAMLIEMGVTNRTEYVRGGKPGEKPDDLVSALEEAERQIVYLHEKFQATGSGEAALAKIRSALASASST